MSWTLPPLHRHLASIGIGPVFVRKPPHPLQSPPVDKEGDGGDGAVSATPAASSPTDTSHTRVLDTWEIVGDIKSKPEDFVVREIGWAPPSHGRGRREVEGDTSEGKPQGSNHSTGKYRRRPGWSRRIAGLAEDGDDAAKHSKCNDDAEEKVGRVEDNGTSPIAKEAQSIETVESTPLQSEEQPPPQTSKGERHESSTELDPASELRRILVRCLSDNGQIAAGDIGEGPNTKADALLRDLAHLQRLAMDNLDSASQPAIEVVKNGDDEKNTVRIPSQLTSKDDRKQLHQCIRGAFPLLQTETCTPNAKGGISTGNTGQSVIVTVDTTFFPLRQYLYNPREDILSLYAFRNMGPVSAPRYDSERSNRNMPKHAKKRRKDRHSDHKEQGLQNEEQSDANEASGVLILRLRPDVPRSERRAIHLTIAGRRRDFDTSTKNDVLCNGTEHTSAIVVQWSFNAIHASGKKRKLNDQGTVSVIPAKRESEGSPSISAIFCVLKKNQCEHQVAIKSLANALRCRPGDIGLAGMKDLQASTCQFCTLRNVDMRRAQRANQSLGKKIQLSGLVEVEDFLLDRGCLLGNRFEITLRNLKRVQRVQTEGEETWTESFIPVHRSHLDLLANRIREAGFINFYGEQRLGDAGSKSHVGVRSFDVGRAMLKRDFDTAIDLIMAGRSSLVYSPGAEEINAREVWKKTGGDARATLKAFPKCRSIMVRERDLLKGMLRYGNALKSFRCIPHNVRMFWIHAYQSYVWNRVASERVRRLGLQPVKGDLYLKDDNTCNDDESQDLEVHVVTDPESVNISQVVLPLPGYNIQYPTNEMGELYQQILRDEGIDLSRKDSIPEATAKGSYRKVIQRAHDLRWEAIPECTGGQLDESEDLVVASAKFTFELPSGCYATMLLREMLVTTMARGSKPNPQ